jgi:hypothetical protein
LADVEAEGLTGGGEHVCVEYGGCGLGELCRLQVDRRRQVFLVQRPVLGVDPTEQGTPGVRQFTVLIGKSGDPLLDVHGATLGSDHAIAAPPSPTRSVDLCAEP